MTSSVMTSSQDSATTACDLVCQHLVRAFGAHQAVDDVSFEVPAGRFFSILGPSGCGKTTLLRMLAGFETPDAGDILIQGRSMLQVPPNRRPVNLVFQQLALFPSMTVAENIAYGLKRHKVPASARRQRIDEVLAQVGLDGLGHRQPAALSGGQRQRVALARCLVLRPALLLLDEPLGALDLKLREQMKVELKHLQQAFGTTFVYITHDQSEAMVMSDQVAVMREGRFEQVDTPEALYHDPQTPFVAGFVGDNNQLEGVVERQEGGQVGVRLSGNNLVMAQCLGPAASVGDQVSLFIRPEFIRMTPLSSGSLSADGVQSEGSSMHCQAEVVTTLFDGANSRVELRIGRQTLMARLPQDASSVHFHPGEWVALSWATEKARVFSGGAS